MMELFLMRPDAVDALERDDVKKILPRYIKIVSGKLPVSFQILKKIKFDPEKDMTVPELWELHRDLMKKFYDLKKKVNRRKIELENINEPTNSLLDLKIYLTIELMKSCDLCERKCGINRIDGKFGDCGVGGSCRISSEFVHLGEEPFLVPSHTLFFTGCNFHCQFCQNWSISQNFEKGSEIVPEVMSTWIEKRKRQGCRNVNFVGGEPTPNLLWILKVLKLVEVNQAVIWNSNFYMTKKTMDLLDGIVDVYLSDFKYGDNECGKRLSKIKNYFEVCSRNHLLASRQTELAIRHLVLPNHIECCTKPILKWLKGNIMNKCIVNLMDQYRPEYKASGYKEINRKITKKEFSRVVKNFRASGINYIT